MAKPLKLPIALPKEDIDSLFKNADSFRDKLILEFIYYCGLRVGEFLSIKIEDIDFKERVIKVASKKKSHGLLGERIIPLPKPLILDLKMYIKMINREEDILMPLTKQRIWQIVKKTADKAGIKKNVHTHTLRHSYATHILEETGNIELVKELLGHETIKTTQIYTHLSTKAKKKAIEAIYG